jgi:aspartate ammonia-lyase
MASLRCLTANHKTLTFDFEEHCITCIENEKDRLRGQLQNCVNHLELAKRKCGHRTEEKIAECIESANKALYETLHT